MADFANTFSAPEQSGTSIEVDVVDLTGDGISILRELHKAAKPAEIIDLTADNDSDGLEGTCGESVDVKESGSDSQRPMAGITTRNTTATASADYARWPLPPGSRSDRQDSSESFCTYAVSHYRIGN
jgi:hypothetical protein